MRVHFVQALSDESGISRPMLSMILNGVATPGLDTLALLLAWDQQFEEPVWRYMNERGHQLRSISVATP
jgi:transcriptional regulator with XRE-family HTH domain